MASKHYVVRFEGNSSKRWDGKEIWLDREVLDELYDPTELCHGANVVVPFKGKGGKITQWNAVFVDSEKVSQTPAEPDATSEKPETTGNSYEPASTPNKPPRKKSTDKSLVAKNKTKGNYYPYSKNFSGINFPWISGI